MNVFSAIPDAKLDLLLSLNVYTLQAFHGPPDSAVRDNLVQAIKRAAIDDLCRTHANISMATQRAIRDKDKEVLTALAQAQRSVLESSASKTELAEVCYALGNSLSACGSPLAPEYWKIAAETFSQGCGQAEFKVGAYINYGAYLLRRKRPGDAAMGTKYIWKALAVMETYEAPETLRLAWCQVAAQLPGKSDRSKACDIIRSVIDEKSSRHLSLSKFDNLFQARVAEVQILNLLGKKEEAVKRIQETRELAKYREVDPEHRFDALAWQARLLGSTPQGLKLWDELFENPYIENVPKDKLTRLYEEASNVCRGGSLMRHSKEGDTPAYVEFLQKSFHLRGMSEDWSRRYFQAWSDADTYYSLSAGRQIEALLRDPETSKLPFNYLLELKNLQVQCLLYSKDFQGAKKTFENMSVEEQKAMAWLAHEIYLQLHDMKKAKIQIDQFFLTLGPNAQFCKQYARGYILFLEEKPDESAAVLEPLVSSLSTGIINKDQRRYFLIFLDKCKAHRVDRNQIVKLLNKADAESKMTEFDYKHTLASILQYNPSCAEEALKIQQALIQSSKFQSLRRYDKYVFYKELAAMQKTVNRPVEAAASEKMAETFLN